VVTANVVEVFVTSVDDVGVVVVVVEVLLTPAIEVGVAVGPDV
jgi:hypothetical protein